MIQFAAFVRDLFLKQGIHYHRGNSGVFQFL